LVGACIGFAAFVWRLVKLGRQLHPEAMGGESSKIGERESAPGIAGSDEDSQGLGEGLGLSDVLRETDEETRTNEERS
jgi:hypothetical protein